MTDKSISLVNLTRLTGHNAAIYCLGSGLRPDTVLSAGGDGMIVEWDLLAPENGKLLARAETRLFSLLPCADLQLLVAGDMDGGVHWIDLADPTRTSGIAHHRKGVFDILRIGDDVFTAGGDGKISRWSATARRSSESLALSANGLRCLAYQPRRNEIAVGASDNNIYLLDANSLELRHMISPAHESSVFTVCYSADGRYLFSGGRDALLRVWDLTDNYKLISSQPAHWYTINHIALHPSGRWLATGSRDKTVKIWDAQSFELVKVLETIRDSGHVNSVNKVWWRPDGKQLVSAGDDRSMIIWEVV
ncbi:MAG: WD40 repeat domain-containing protein [Saprospiraceae bacterium]|nr:WD40 repeat domain-containing protein [Saprospiraceae bacterium]